MARASKRAASGGAKGRGSNAVGGPPLVPRRAFAELEADFHAVDAVPGARQQQAARGNSVGGAKRVKAKRTAQGHSREESAAAPLSLGVGGVGLQVSGQGESEGGGWVGVGDRVAEEKQRELMKERRAEERLKQRIQAGGARAMMPGGGGGAPVRIPAGGSREASPIQAKPRKKKDTLKLAAMAYGVGGKPSKKKKKAPHKRSLLML